MKTIVVSAVNLRKGGTLTILRDCLEYLSGLAVSGKYKVVAIVHRKELADYPGVQYIELPWTIKSWLLRLWCEYVTMYFISLRLQPVTLWLSLHDTTPNVRAERQVVYCHNPFPFYKWKWKELFLNYHIVCFAWFSKYIYQINIHKNDRILVQQEWIRKAFVNMFHITGKNIIVTVPATVKSVDKQLSGKLHNTVYCFLFPSYCDIHKNFELICEAAYLLEKEIGPKKFKVVLTISGTENKYAKGLFRKWGKLSSIEFAGFMSKSALNKRYLQSDCLIFPSRVETWGLPISEFAVYGKPMLLADLPYAHETAAGSLQTAFFDPERADILKLQMLRLIKGDTSFLSSIPELHIAPPVSHSWKEMFNLLLK